MLALILLSGCASRQEAPAPEPDGREEVSAPQGGEEASSGEDSPEGDSLSQETLPPQTPASEEQTAQESGGPEGASQETVLPQGPWDRPYEEAHPYIRELCARIAQSLVTPQMTEYEKAKAAFDYIIDNTVLDEPVGLELWRVHGGGEEAIPFVEQRALSPLRFGVGMCEDYAAALTLLLREMGLEAMYVPGLTYSVEGHLVDHAWTAAKVDGVWYHLDSQLEDNISRRGSVGYRYFMRGDATLSGSHVWGQDLINSGVLTPEQVRAVEESFLVPACPEDYPTPQRRQLPDSPAVDVEALRQEAEAEIAAYEAENGPLSPMELNTVPPVFGLEGFGPADEG